MPIDELATVIPTTPARPGRPRRYDETEEQALLLDAAFEVIRAKGYAAVTVVDILREAGMSTRAFYRHFTSKEELLHALFRRDAERFADAVARRTRAADDGRRAVEVWIDEILGFGLDRPRAQRAAVLGSATAKGALAPNELRHALELLTASLEEALAAGRADGSLPGADAADAPLISSATWDTSSRMGEADSKAAKARHRAALLSFVRRGLGVTE